MNTGARNTCTCHASSGWVGMPHLPAFQSFFSLPECARANRKLLTESEFVLWQALRGSQLGVKFRRQHVLSPFIVDFYAASAKLVVEIDGAVHAGRAVRDAARATQLAALHGVRVLCVAAADVMLNVVAVLASVRAAL